MINTNINKKSDSAISDNNRIQLTGSIKALARRLRSMKIPS
tara:strand:+ start:589 stop:711 length:123 start_codon:yes stop_codon:yes gene_type:complete